MAFVKTGMQRTLNLTVKKTGNDLTIEDPYLTLDGKEAFGAYTIITQDEMQKLSNVDFAARVTAWKLHLQSTYAISDPNLYTDIEASFKYVNGIIIRLQNDNQTGALICTSYPAVMDEEIGDITFLNTSNNTTVTTTIHSGSHTVDLTPSNPENSEGSLYHCYPETISTPTIISNSPLRHYSIAIDNTAFIGVRLPNATLLIPPESYGKLRVGDKLGTRTLGLNYYTIDSYDENTHIVITTPSTGAANSQPTEFVRLRSEYQSLLV